jgi:hypothetical protein
MAAQSSYLVRTLKYAFSSQKCTDVKLHLTNFLNIKFPRITTIRFLLTNLLPSHKLRQIKFKMPIYSPTGTAQDRSAKNIQI